ncbi:MAG: acylase [Planctomycetota bacterium]|nr:MAG: acylase [Planctomycetota bacterium]
MLLALSLLFLSPQNPTEIHWDRWGIPHIQAADSESLFYAFGYCQAQSHADHALILFGRARGRAAEYWGESYFESDRWLTVMGVPELAEKHAQAMQPVWRQRVQAFVDGFNDYCQAHPQKVNPEAARALPVRVQDVLAHGLHILHFRFVSGPELLEKSQRQLSRGGSNAWAVAPKRSSSGNAMLLANPHLPYGDVYLFYEAHLRCPEYQAYGVTLVGSPVLGIAFNQKLGWTHTNNTHDGADLYRLELKESQYKFGKTWRPLEERTHRISVRQNDGKMAQKILQVKSSLHGPLVAEQGNTALALRVVGLDRPAPFRQWWAMGKAQSFAEFRQALDMQLLPMWTVMYADAAGNIMHLFGGLTPIRPQGPFAWDRDVDGTHPGSLWHDYHSVQELPQLLNPSSGWLQNANDPPWTTTRPLALHAADYPNYMAPRFMHFRAQSSARLLHEDPEIDFEEFVRYKHSTRMELAERILDPLIAAAKSGDALAKEGAEVLQQWDRCCNAGSRGAVLFERFVEEARRHRVSLFQKPWTEEEPFTSPQGLADPETAASLLSAAAGRVKAAYGSIDVPWGEVYRLRRDEVDLPANGGPGSLGVFRVVGFESKGKTRSATWGDSYVAAVEFSDPPRARALLTYGNASQPGSPHRTDQLPLFARQELRPVHWQWPEAVRQAQRTESLPPWSERSKVEKVK